MFSSIDPGSVKLAWEIRGRMAKGTIEKQGWKVFDLSETEHVHASILLKKLPDVKFAHVEEVIEALKKPKK